MGIGVAHALAPLCIQAWAHKWWRGARFLFGVILVCWMYM